MILLRVVLFLGIALILVGGGAAGWQYYQQNMVQTAELPGDEAAAAGEEGEGQAPASAGAVAAEKAVLPEPAAAAVAAPSPASRQSWLISAAGGLVAREVSDAILRQDQPVAGRALSVQLRLKASLFLAPGERLPDHVYREVFADIRAPRIGQDLCRVLLEAWAEGCQVASVGIEPGSYGSGSETVLFRAELRFSQKPGAAALPDLASHVLRTGQESMGINHEDIGSREELVALMQEVVQFAGAVCDPAEAEGKACRLIGVTLAPTSSFSSDAAPSYAKAEFGWFDSMPRGMYPAPPLY